MTSADGGVPSGGIASVLGPLSESPPPRSAGGAAVLAVLRQGQNDVEVLLIVRAERDDDPASGQIGLPGGHTDEGDATLSDTALRELEEEVGLGRSDLSGPPRFHRLATASVFSLTVGVFAAELGPGHRPPRARDPGEVAHVFWLPRSELRTYRPVVRETSNGPRTVEAVVFNGHVLWGFTRRVLLDLFGINPVEAS